MFRFLTPGHRDEMGPLANVVAADKFWRSLPRSDPLAAQKEICEALSDLCARKDLTRDFLRALLALDQRSRSLADALLVNYLTRNPQARSIERRFWRAAAEMSQAFAGTFSHFLRHLRNDPGARAWRDYAPAVVLRMFRHRQVEFMLRPFLNDAPVPETWTELHSTYQFAEAQGWSHHPVPGTGNPDTNGIESTLQKEYVHILLLELMNGGQFSPYDAFWLSRWIPHWYAALRLEDDPPGVRPDGDHFVVDLYSSDGLKRVSSGTHGQALYFDSSALLSLIEAEIEALRDPLAPVRVPSSFGRARELKLLRKLAANYTPRPQRVSRRGERKAVTSTVKAVVGLAQIMRMLRHEEKKKAAAAPVAVPEVEEITITVDGGYTETPLQVVETGDRPRTNASGLEFGVPHHYWQVKDRSASGCRLRAPAGDMAKVPPGTLIAIRDDDTPRWSLVVVRRVKTRIGDRIEIGVEYVGQNPRGVTMALDGHPGARAKDATAAKPHLFTAVYLRESVRQPAMPFKTLIMATSAVSGARCLTLRSATAEYTVRLKEPIEEQDDFIWLPYEVLERRAVASVDPHAVTDDMGTSKVPVRAQPPLQDTGTASDWLIPQFGKRVENAA